MTDQHPITPPPELVEQWANSSPLQHSDEWWAYELLIAHHAARWGADQELEACVNYVDNAISGNKARALRAARRPKPPSLAEQALVACERSAFGIPGDRDTIRRALERLKELEGTMTDLTPNDLSHLSDEAFWALCPQGEHAPGPEPLSLAAQAVIDAYANAIKANPHGRWCENAIAAALRAAADLVPDHQMSAHILHAIAAELENHQ